jgi:type II secretory pathway pseudopilin PulG
MRRLLATLVVIGVIAAVGALAAPTALAAPRLLQVSPKQVSFGTQPVGR